MYKKKIINLKNQGYRKKDHIANCGVCKLCNDWHPICMMCTKTKKLELKHNHHEYFYNYMFKHYWSKL